MSTSVRYSEGFKLQVIDELSSGKFKNIAAARAAYGITGARTVQLWLRKYGREDLLTKQIRIESVAEKDEKKELKERVKNLETALSDAHIDCSLDRAFLEIACERLGIDINEFKKKHALTLSDVRRMKGRK
jgi:transposase-like protein